jgi:hypothetical protein
MRATNDEKRKKIGGKNEVSVFFVNFAFLFAKAVFL